MARAWVCFPKVRKAITRQNTTSMKSDVKCITEEDKNGKDRERCRERERVRKRETEMERESFKASEEMTYERVWLFMSV